MPKKPLRINERALHKLKDARAKLFAMLPPDLQEQCAAQYGPTDSCACDIEAREGVGLYAWSWILGPLNEAIRIIEAPRNAPKED